MPYELPDQATLEQAMFAIAPIYRVDPKTVQQVVPGTFHDR